MRSTPAAPHDQRELVAAQAREVIDLADRLTARVRDRAQDGVADRVAVDVVDRLEAVEVEQHEREFAARDLLGQRGVERAPVVQPGERVALGHPALALLRQQQPALECVHRDRDADDRAREDQQPRGIAERDDPRVVEQRRRVGGDESAEQRPGEPGREEVRDEHRREQQHRLQEARRPAGRPQGERDDGHHPRGDPGALPEGHGRPARGEQKRDRAPADGERRDKQLPAEVRAYGAGQRQRQQTAQPGADPHVARREVGKPSLVARVLDASCRCHLPGDRLAPGALEESLGAS
jgi:hypothetical protein